MDNNFRFSDHLENYPPVIPRAKVSKYFPWLSQKRLANLDKLGQGPGHAFKNGRAVLYPTWEFLEWLDGRTGPLGRAKTDKNQNKEKVNPPSVKRRGRKTKEQEVRDRRG